MKKWLSLGLSIILVLFLISCSFDQYSPITDKEALVLTVNIKDMTVTFLDIDSGKKIDEWQMDKPYIGGLILPDGDSLLLYGKQLETVDLYSLKLGKKLSSWNTGKGITNGILMKNQKEIAFADQSRHAIRFFTLSGKEKKSIRTDNNPLTLLEEQRKNQLYIISYRSGSMTVVDTERKKKIRSFPIHSSAAGALLREEKNEIWIGGHGEGSEIGTLIYVYQTGTGELLKTIEAPLMPINFTHKGENVYALSHGSSTLYQLNTDGKIIGSAKVGANPFEMKVMDNYIIIAGYDSDDVSLVDFDTLKIEKAIQVGKGPFQLILRERISNEQH